MKKLTLSVVYRCLQFFALLSIIAVVWSAVFSYRYLGHEQFQQVIIPAVIISLVLPIITIILCWLKWRIALLYVFIVNLYPFITNYNVGFTPFNFFEMGAQSQLTMLSYILSIVMSVVGIVLVIKNYLDRHKTNQ